MALGVTVTFNTVEIKVRCELGNDVISDINYTCTDEHSVINSGKSVVHITDNNEVSSL